MAQNAYGALAGVDSGHIGGIEHQQSMVAKWLAKRGYQVSMITWDEGQEEGIEIDGVSIFKTCRKEAGIKGLKFLWPKWTSLCRAMKRANADIYYYNCGDLGLGQVALWCHRHDRKCLYSVASNPDCDPRLPALKALRERILYKYGLRHVHRVIVQTSCQKKMLSEGFGISSTVLPMPCESFSVHQEDPVKLSGELSSRVLWVGRISKEKRLDWLLDIAEAYPETAFHVVGAANSDFDYANALMKRAANISNVKMHGRIAHTEMATYYRQCRVLCCTSAYEGFPNTFLEAWSLGIPVVSTFDPDNVIRDNGLGVVAQDADGIVLGLKKLIQSRDVWEKASRAAKEYYMAYHTPEAYLSKLERLLLEEAGCERLEIVCGAWR
ncbi:MAG: glycosyltransferase family 4 protein [Sedimentisphaerales bacterium]